MQIEVHKNEIKEEKKQVRLEDMMGKPNVVHTQEIKKPKPPPPMARPMKNTSIYSDNFSMSRTIEHESIMEVDEEYDLTDSQDIMKDEALLKQLKAN